MKMERFDYYLDRKVTGWQRTHLTIEATSRTEADMKVQEIIEDDNVYDEPHFVENETLYESFEPMSVSENDGFATEELFNSADELIWDNTTK